MRRALSACLLAALAAAASAQHRVEVGADRVVRHGDIVTDSRGLTLPAGEFTVAEFVDAVAAYLCRNYVYDPEVVLSRPPFRLQRSLALDAVGSEEVLYALLAARDLVALPLDPTRGLYQVAALDRSGTEHPMAVIPWRRPQDVLARANLRELVMTTLHLANLDAREVAPALRSHFAMQRSWRPGAPTITHADDHTLVLHGYGDQLSQVIRALQQLDALSAPATPTANEHAALLRRVEALERELAALKRQLGR